MAAGDDSGSSAGKGLATRLRGYEYGTRTIALPFFPRATAPVHINQLYALLLLENACYERIDTICVNRLVPLVNYSWTYQSRNSRPASTDETLQIP